MRILSQDKTVSVDESGVPLLVSEDSVIAVPSVEPILLGEYKSKERAMEVLADTLCEVLQYQMDYSENFTR